MIQSAKSNDENIKKVITESTSEDLSKIVKKTKEHFSLLRKFPKSEKLNFQRSEGIKNSAQKKLNEHDMLQANQANLKCSPNYASNIKQVINSTLQVRYQKLQNISLHQILSKGNY